MTTVNTDFRQEFADLLRNTIIAENDEPRAKLEKYSRLNNCILMLC